MTLSTTRIEMQPVAALRPYPGNARKHSKKQVKQIADSISLRPSVSVGHAFCPAPARSRAKTAVDVGRPFGGSALMEAVGARPRGRALGSKVVGIIPWSMCLGGMLPRSPLGLAADCLTRRNSRLQPRQETSLHASLGE